MSDFADVLASGGGIVTCRIKSKRARRQARRELRRLGAKQSNLGIWKLEEAAQQAPLPAKAQFGAERPPVAPTADAEEEEEEDYGPSLHSVRAPVKAEAAAAGAAADESTSQQQLRRGEWMSAALPMSDPQRALRHHAQTSQQPRTFANLKTSSSTSNSGTEDVVNSRERATGRVEQQHHELPAAASLQQQEPFRWDHAEMMGSNNEVDQARLRNELQSGIASRFASAGSGGGKKYQML